MPDFDKNAAYIWACYGVGALIILALTVQTLLAARAARARLAMLDPGNEDGDGG
jgi:heme exporter protein CcmD